MWQPLSGCKLCLAFVRTKGAKTFYEVNRSFMQKYINTNFFSKLMSSKTFLKRNILLPPATKLGQGYIFTGICDSVHRGGSTWAGTPPGTRYTPQDQVPPGPGTPSGTRYTPQTRYTTPWTRYTPRTRYTPWEQCMLGDTGNKWVVCILLECILVCISPCRNIKKFRYLRFFKSFWHRKKHCTQWRNIFFKWYHPVQRRSHGNIYI